MCVIIEKAKEEHKPVIMSLLKQANMHYIPSAEMPQLSYDNYFVAKLEGNVVGFCGYKILDSKNAKTELMVVDRKYRGKGIGYLLQEYRMEDMLSKGIENLITNADLPETVNWYMENFGYKKIARLKKNHEFGEPSISYWTTLKVSLKEWAAKRKEAV